MGKKNIVTKLERFERRRRNTKAERALRRRGYYSPRQEKTNARTHARHVGTYVWHSCLTPGCEVHPTQQVWGYGGDVGQLWGMAL